LYAASSDGTIGVFNFAPEELEGIAPHSVQEQYLQKFGFSAPPLPEGYSHVATRETSQITPPPSPSRLQSKAQQSTGFGNVNGSGERVNMLVAKRSNKKRANLTTQVGSVPSAGAGIASANNVTGLSTAAPVSKRVQLTQIKEVTMSSVPSISSPSFPSPSEQLYDVPDSWSRHADVSMDLDVPIDALDSVASPARGKRKASAIIDLTEETRTTKARTLGGDRPRDIVPVKEIGAVEVGMWGAQPGMSLPVPPILTAVTAEIEGSDDVFEGRNSEDDSTWSSCFAACRKLI
jgi:protein HIRA/HIR1